MSGIKKMKTYCSSVVLQNPVQNFFPRFPDCMTSDLYDLVHPLQPRNGELAFGFGHARVDFLQNDLQFFDSKRQKLEFSWGWRTIGKLDNLAKQQRIFDQFRSRNIWKEKNMKFLEKHIDIEQFDRMFGQQCLRRIFVVSRHLLVWSIDSGSYRDTTRDLTFCWILIRDTSEGSRWSTCPCHVDDRGMLLSTKEKLRRCP